MIELGLTVAVGDYPISKKIAHLLLKDQLLQTGINCFLLRPAKEANQAILDLAQMDIDGENPEIISSHILFTLKKGKLYVGKAKASEYIQVITENYELTAISKKTIRKITQIQLAKLEKHKKQNPSFNQEEMRMEIKNHSSYMEIESKKDAESFLKETNARTAFLVWESSNNETPSPIRQTFSQRSLTFIQHNLQFTISYFNKEKEVQHHPFLVDPQGNIVDRKRALVFTHFQRSPKNQDGEVFLTSLLKDLVPIADFQDLHSLTKRRDSF
jgi:hypothetical protein